MHPGRRRFIGLDWDPTHGSDRITVEASTDVMQGCVSLPHGWSGGLPLAFQLVGRPWSEETLFPTALWCEGVVGRQRRAVMPDP